MPVATGESLREHLDKNGAMTVGQAVRFANLLHAAGLMVIPAGTRILRLLPPLVLREIEADEGLQIIEGAARVCA